MLVVEPPVLTQVDRNNTMRSIVTIVWHFVRNLFIKSILTLQYRMVDGRNLPELLPDVVTNRS